MIDVEDLIALVRNYNPRCNAEAIRLAYGYGTKMHQGQFRKSGEPYFTHPVAVAAILTEQQLDDATIITALLHDVIDDAADVDDDEKDTTGKVFKLVPQFGNRATLVISTNQNAPTPASADDDDQKGAKIEWPKFRKQNLAVSNY